MHLILHWSTIFGIFLVLSACGDLVEESDTSSCNSAIDARNYEKALSVCSSRKDKATAYMGKAGYDIINLLKSSATTVTAYTKPTALGTDDIAGASILNILQLSVANIANDDERAKAISKSKTNLNSAYELLQRDLNELSADEILLNTFAISFAMQLNQLEVYDNATTTAEAYPALCNGCSHVDNLTCTEVDISNSDATANLKAMDGHLWTKERNGTQCNSILGAMKGITDSDEQNAAFINFNAWVDNTSRGKLPEPFATTVCGPISSLTDYLADLTLNLNKLSTLSGDNTKAITNAETSSDALLKAVGCSE